MAGLSIETSMKALAASRSSSSMHLTAGEKAMKTHLPSLRALQTPEDEPLREELSLLAIREQVAVVRAFADEVERLTFGGRMCGPYEQLVEELARLGCRIL